LISIKMKTLSESISTYLIVTGTNLEALYNLLFFILKKYQSCGPRSDLTGSSN